MVTVSYPENPLTKPMKRFTSFIPGLTLTAILAFASLYLASFSWFKQLGISPTIVAIVLGVIIGNIAFPKWAFVFINGVDFSKQKLLRLAIILFGLRLTFQDIVEVGIPAIIVDLIIVCSTFALAMYLGSKVFKCDRVSTILIGCGSSICGAAAIMAASPVIKADSEKVSVAVANIVIFGTLAMFIYPLIAYLATTYWGVNEIFLGIYTGSTIHEVAQVAVAGEAIGQIAANNAVITKMIRVLMLAPFLLCLSLWESFRESRQPLAGAGSGAKQPIKITIPWFAVGFIAMACINSTGIIAPALTQQLIWLDNLLLTTAMAALGLTTHYSAIKKAGVKPLLLAFVLFLWLCIGGWLINAIIDIL